jgi:hypothetical protein
MAGRQGDSAGPGDIVYVDDDPIVLTHARALLTSTPEGACQYIEADVREPAKILGKAAETLDFSQPVAVMILMTLQHAPDADNPGQTVATLLEAVSPGSCLAVSDVARDLAADANVVASTNGSMSGWGRPVRPSAARSRSRAYSTAWRWWRRAWCSCLSGGPISATPGRCRA